RGTLIATCTGVSFAHGSNDGQKGMGLGLPVSTTHVLSSGVAGTRLGAAVGDRAQPVDGVGADAASSHHAFRESLRLVCQLVLRRGGSGTPGGVRISGRRPRRGTLRVEEGTMKAMDVMVRDVVTVKPETDVASAIKLLIEHDISALPVVEDG